MRSQLEITELIAEFENAKSGIFPHLIERKAMIPVFETGCIVPPRQSYGYKGRPKKEKEEKSNKKRKTEKRKIYIGIGNLKYHFNDSKIRLFTQYKQPSEATPENVFGLYREYIGKSATIDEVLRYFIDKVNEFKEIYEKSGG